ncbi:hypothetical protein HB770_02285 [Rhizobium leguminosarum bv. viciae]|uniref:Uncharacterized protein n=1 Tax=Rhizobium leguminosarum bv. viciae TaxID=387 RepID=A0A7G6RHG5_RHILV|nr:hypothetical protein HB770_02285 [Rhizobium leguminosarum bv. viciae]
MSRLQRQEELRLQTDNGAGREPPDRFDTAVATCASVALVPRACLHRIAMEYLGRKLFEALSAIATFGANL